MSQTDIITNAGTITNRPDLSAEHTLASNLALKWAHWGRPQIPEMAALPAVDFVFDLVEASTPIPPDPNNGSTTATDFTLGKPDRFRKLKYIYVDPPNNPPAPILQDTSLILREISPGSLFDPSTMMETKNYYYQSGLNLVCHTELPRSNVYYGYFQWPSWDDSYIMNNFPELLIVKTAAEVFRMLGDPKMQAYLDMANRMVQELASSQFSF